MTAFLVIFRSLHEGDRGTPEIQFRLRLLRFTAIFSSRFGYQSIKPSSKRLKDIRKQTQRRRKTFATADDLAIPANTNGTSQPVKAQHQEKQADSLLASIYGPADCVPLIDTLPSFMELSATQSALQELPVTQVWMRLAAGYMAHAALEQSLVYGMKLKDALQEAFAWRFDPNSTAKEGTAEWAINTMFFGEDGEVDEWSNIRNEHICLAS